jgi:thiamine kinase-like enzyme
MQGQTQFQPPAPVGPRPPQTVNNELKQGPGPNTVQSRAQQGLPTQSIQSQQQQQQSPNVYQGGLGRQRGRGFRGGRGRGRGFRGGRGRGARGGGWGRGRGFARLQGQGGQGGQGGGLGRGQVRFNGAVFSRNYVPVQLERQQQVEQVILHHIDPNYKSLYPMMDAALKSWKCAQCGLINQLYYLRCTGCATYLPTALRVGMLINICKTYMNEWNNYNNNQFNLSTLFSSNINRLYLVTLNPDGPFIPNSNIRDRLQHVVIRLWRPDYLIESKRKQMDECYQLFEKANLGPKILAKFEIGQIEEHINGKKIYHSKQFMDEVMYAICDKLVTIHQMKPNNEIFDSNKDTFYNKFKSKCEEMRKYININKEQLLLEGFEFTGKDLKTIGEILTLFPDGVDNILEQFEWLKSEINELIKDAWWESKDNQMVFCHNDIYQGNIMEIFDNNNDFKNQINSLTGQDLDNYILNNYGGDLKIIDYDTCCFNYRYYDISNFMIELCIEYFRIIQYPFVVIEWSQYPDHEWRCKFVKRYLSKLTNKKEESDISMDDVNLFLKLIDLMGLLSDLYLGISTFVYGIQSEHKGHAVVRGGKRRYDEPEQIRMDYFEYSVNRLKNYWFSKDQITNGNESERIDPNLGYNLESNANINGQNTSWYAGYGPIMQSLGGNSQKQQPQQSLSSQQPLQQSSIISQEQQQQDGQDLTHNNEHEEEEHEHEHDEEEEEQRHEEEHYMNDEHEEDMIDMTHGNIHNYEPKDSKINNNNNNNEQSQQQIA